MNSRVHLHIPDMSRPEDGIAKLKHLEMTKGIWTMRCQLIIETRDLVIIDKQTGGKNSIITKIFKSNQSKFITDRKGR